MTLCVAWIRQTGEDEELVFATDSRLTGGESWDNGVKLFDLPRKDCLLCFAGSTSRAYPLILNSVSSIKFDNKLANSHTDIHDILEYLLDLFTNLCSEIDDPVEDIHKTRAEAEFIFGGWSWRKQSFCIWRLYYEPSLEGFTHESLNTKDIRVFTFLGDYIQEAKQLLIDELKSDDDYILKGALGMEPLKVLARMARDESYSEIGGALQIAKVYKSGTSEFFGLMWPSIEGEPTFLGRNVHQHAKPPVRFFDPDLGEIIESPLPSFVANIDRDIYGRDKDFVEECYPNGKLKENLSEAEKDKLCKILMSVAYDQFCRESEEADATKASEANDENK